MTSYASLNAAPEAEVLKPEAYGALIHDLIAKGQIYGKAADVAAFKMLDLTLVTQNATGQDEVSRSVALKDKLYMVFDTKFWPTHVSRTSAVSAIAIRWARQIIGEEDLNHPDFKGPGLWTSKAPEFEFDYIKKPNADNESATDMYTPNPEARRLCLAIDHDIKIPTPWGEPFLIPAGGTLAIRERDVPELVGALHKISAGAKPEDVLLKKNASGQTVSAFDIYGMMPEFLDADYKLATAKPETSNILALARATFAGEHTGGHNPVLDAEVSRMTRINEVRDMIFQLRKVSETNLPTAALIGAVEQDNLAIAQEAIKLGANTSAWFPASDRYDTSVVDAARSEPMRMLLESNGGLSRAKHGVLLTKLEGELSLLANPKANDDLTDKLPAHPVRRSGGSVPKFPPAG